MDPKEVRRYLQKVALGLQDLGPFERRRALKEIRADLTDYAMDGMQTAPSKERLEGATRAMPPPEEVAESYMTNARPPLTAIRASCLVNLLISLGPLVFGAFLLNVPPGMSLPTPGLLMALVFLVIGGFGVFVYGLGVVSPRRASRWRYAILPAIAVSVILDSVFGTVLALGLLWPDQVGFLLPIILLVGGAYSVAYTHGQLPRVAFGPAPGTGGDYFRALDRSLRDLDLARRKAIASELRAHLEASGVDLDALPPAARRSAAEKVLGPPGDIAAGYLEEARVELPAARRRGADVAFACAVVGLPIGATLLVWGLLPTISPSSWGDYALTLIGLAGSAGLLIVSLGALGGALHLRRLPAKGADSEPPTIALALAAALIIVAVLGATPAGGLAEAVAHKTFAVQGGHIAPDGGLDLFWTSAPVDYGGPFPGNAGPPDGAWITRLDAQRNVLGVEPIPFALPSGQLLALERDGGTWMALFADHFWTWGAQNVGADLDQPFDRSAVAGRLDTQSAAVAWSSRPQSDVLAVRFESFGPPWISNEALWDRTYVAPGWQESRIAVGADRLLAVTTSNVVNDSYERSEILGFLLDLRGNAIANVTLLRDNVTRAGPDDGWNGTFAHVNGVHAVTGGFLVVGTSWVSSGGTQVLRCWAAGVNATDGSVNTVELQRDEVPAAPSPPRPGDRFVGATQTSVGRDDEVLIATSVWEWVTNATGGGQIDPLAGGVYVSGLRADRTLDFSVRLSGATEFFFLGPILAGWGTDPIVFVPRWPETNFGPFTIDAYEVPAPTREVRHTNLTIGLAEESLLLNAVMNMGSATGLGTGPGIAEFTGQLLVEDCGLLGWREHAWGTRGCVYPAPGLVRLDVPRGTSTVILLGPPATPPDTVAGLVATSVVATLAVLAVQLGYPRLRAWRLEARNRNRSEPRVPV